MALVVLRDGNPHRMLTLPVWLEVLREAARLGAVVLATPADPPVDPWLSGLAPRAVHDLPAAAGPEEVARTLGLLGASAVLSVSDPDPPRLRDAMAVDLALGRTARARGSAPTVARAMHKGRTRKAWRQQGIQVPEGAWLRGRSHVTALPAAWGERLVVKDVVGWAGEGTTFHDSSETAFREVRSRGGQVVVERFIDGEEVSVDTVVAGRRQLLAGWVLKGPTSGLHPLFRMRYVPNEPIPGRLRAMVAGAVACLRLDGIVDLDLVVDRDGTPFLLEVNPRASGVTAVLRAASGVGAPALGMRLAVGEQPGPIERPACCACEFSVSARSLPRLLAAGRGMSDLVHVHTTVTNNYPARCYLAATEPEGLLRDVERLADACGPKLVEELLDRVSAAERLAARLAA